MPNMKLLLSTLVLAVGLSQVTAGPAGYASSGGPETSQSSSVNAAGPQSSDAYLSTSKHSDGGAYPTSKATEPHSNCTCSDGGEYGNGAHSSSHHSSLSAMSGAPAYTGGYSSAGISAAGTGGDYPPPIATGAVGSSYAGDAGSSSAYAPGASSSSAYASGAGSSSPYTTGAASSTSAAAGEASSSSPAAGATGGY